MNIEELDKQIKYSKAIVLIVPTFVVFSYLIWFFIINSMPFSKSTDTWGQFGDFIGGILNPLFSLLAFYWLVTSVRLQKIELTETKNALLESKDAQIEQARILSNSSLLSAFNSLLSSTNSDLQNLRKDKEFMCGQLIEGHRIFDLNGDYINPNDCQHLIKSIDSEINDTVEIRDALKQKILELIAVQENL